MTTTILDLRSGGAILTVNGVDMWCPSRRDALAELDACQSRPTVDYPDTDLDTKEVTA